MSGAPASERVRHALHHGLVVALGLLAVVYGLRMLLGDPVGAGDAVRTVGLAALAGVAVAAKRYRDAAADDP